MTTAKELSKQNRLRQPGRLIAAFLLITGLVVVGLFAWGKRQRNRLYRRLRQRQQAIMRDYEPSLQLPSAQPQEIPSFVEHFAVIKDFLPAATFEQLKAEIVHHAQTERTYLPIQKQGGTVAYETLHETAPHVVAFYNSEYLRTFFSSIVGAPVRPTPINDQSSCSLLFYTQAGDHINWHYDLNFYDGRHFTVLIPIVNQRNGEPEKLSAAQLLIKRDGHEQALPSIPNTLIIFEGAKVFHKVTQLGPNETRIMLSMTFATVSEASFVKALARRIKDVAFFGVRALWT